MARVDMPVVDLSDPSILEHVGDTLLNDVVQRCYSVGVSVYRWLADEFRLDSVLSPSLVQLPLRFWFQIPL